MESKDQPKPFSLMFFFQNAFQPLISFIFYASGYLLGSALFRYMLLARLGVFTPKKIAS